MTRLTVTEKEHWKSRIERQIDKSIDQLIAQKPNLLISVEEKANQAAYDSLGIGKIKKKADALESQIASLEAEHKTLELQMQSHITGKPSADSWSDRDKLKQVVTRQQKIHEVEFLAKSSLGKQILSLRDEKEELLDTVWLATSSVQIKELWGRVTELLGDKSTILQQDTLASQPIVGER